jgi:septal ring factor EnvC (AmiA/AmiB activator)
MSLESWKSFFEIGGVLLLFLTFVFGAGVVITSTRINARQAVQLRNFDKQLTDAKSELGKQQERTAQADARVAGLETDSANAKSEMAKQQTRAANAERALLELQQRLAHRRISQSDHDKLVASLQPFRGSIVHLTRLSQLEASKGAKLFVFSVGISKVSTTK